jgi:diguanylate cyclase (GGDEF)-like protein/PAS domain S-box-containing protein
MMFLQKRMHETEGARLDDTEPLSIGHDVPAADGITLDLESQYRSIFENAVEGIYQTTVDGRYLRVNPALAQIYGYASPEAMIAALTDIAGQLYVLPQKRDEFTRAMTEHGLIQNFEAQVYRVDHSVIWITENARCVRDAGGAILYFEGTVEDITQRKANEEQIRLLATVFDSVGDGILIVDGERLIRAVNPAYETLTHCTAEELVGKTLDMFAHGTYEKSFLPTIWAEVARTGRWTGEAMCWRKDSDPFIAELSFSAVRGGGEIAQFVVITCADISLRKQQEQRIWHHANYDLLTQLPNRLLVTERLQQAMLAVDRQRTGLAVLFLDLNGFKDVNDALGHQAGDDLLRAVASRLRACTRASDVVGRFGGDEFLIIAPGVVDREKLISITDKILYTFSDPFRIGERSVYCRPSIGVAYYPEDGKTPETLIHHADIAMYEAKKGKSERFVVFEPRMQKTIAYRLDLQNDLQRALEQDEFELHYQPKFDSESGLVLGAEALLRWRHPERGLLLPGEFIGLAEESGLIVPIGEWTLRHACTQFVRWRQDGLPIETVAVNLSPRQFLDINLLTTVESVIAATGIDRACLELELTESAMAVDVERAISTLTALKGLGVRLSIDDFGTGYSSLGRLKSLPVDVIKIDRAFIRDLGNNAADGKIVKAIIDLAEVVGFDVIAEGVETVHQADILRGLRCRLLQGYLISHPVEASQFRKFLGTPILIS